MILVGTITTQETETMSSPVYDSVIRDAIVKAFRAWARVNKIQLCGWVIKRFSVEYRAIANGTEVGNSVDLEDLHAWGYLAEDVTG